jgi:hypothetical protein
MFPAPVGAPVGPPFLLSWTLRYVFPFRSSSSLLDDYNFFGGHAYFGSPLGGLHTYPLTLVQRFCIQYSRGGTTLLKTSYK